ncbi:MAG: FIST C-terminal domain-containing protein [Myxococcales bacterium]|nr:FIST C-terminal domain-containing protein [Myxococcales bacterium]
MGSRLEVREAATRATDEREAVAHLIDQIGKERPALTLFFCSSTYELPRLAAHLTDAFPENLLGCTSSGQIGRSGFELGGMSALSLFTTELDVQLHAVAPLARSSERAEEIGAAIRARRAVRRVPAFGLVLVDGLSLAEERLVSSLYAALGDVPLVGGSAGDDLGFEATHVFHGGRFARDSAVLAYVETSLPFRTLRFQHFVPTERRMVITDAVPEKRIVTEINGFPAAQEYARLIGRDVSALDADVFSKHPLLLRIDDEYFVRSIAKRGDDDSLTFFCAIEPGLVLQVGRGVDPLAAIREGLSPRAGEGPAEVVIGCDCILRRLEFEGSRVAADVGHALAEHHVFGFSTYGEQFNALHVNQTFTGVRLGG